MDIYHPDPGSCPQVAPSVETPVKSDNLALINTVESMKNIPLDESAPTAQSSEGLAPLRLIPLHVPGFADSIDRNTNRGPLDEDIKMSDLEQTQSSQGSAFPFAEDPSVNTKGLGPVYDQDIAMADHHTEVQFGSSSLQSTDHKEAEYLPKPQGTKPTDDLLIPDVQGVQTLSAKSLPSGIGAAHRTDPIGGASAELIVSYQQDRNLALQSLAYLPPQPYGCSPYPSITTTSPPMKPLPLSPSISYASTADLNERDGIDLGPPSLVAVPLVTGTNGAEGSTASIEPSLSAQSHGTGTTRSSDDHLASDWTIDRSKTTDQSLLIPQQNINPASLSQTLAQTLALSSFEKQNGITEHRYDPNHLDLLPRIKGLYRLLDLYSETTGSGLVDKIIISQASLGQFINAVLPGAYTSVTKIDFHRLDREARLPLIGIYGSKTEIIRFLLAAGSIDDDAAGLLQLPEDISIRTRPVLRSGIYMLDPPNSDRDSSNPPTRYVIYWPENTTWEAQSSGSVRKNRVTFMRYLTCLTDQIRCLVSPEHGEKLVFEDEDDDADGSGDDGFDLGWGERDDGVNDRFFKFEVAKTSEQEENSRVEGGFKIEDRSLLARVKVPLPNGRSLNLEPHLLAGETVQAFSSLKYNEGFDKEVIIDGAFNHHRFKYTLKGYGSILIPETMEQNDLDLLLDKGDLEHRLPPGLTKDYRKKMSEIQTRYEEEERKTLKQALQSAKDSHSRLKSETRLFLINRLFDTYPCLDWKALFPGEIQPTTATDKDPLEYLNFVLFTSSIVQEALDVSMKDARLDSISYKAYAQVKKPFMIVRNVLDKHPDLTDEQRAVLVKAIAQEDPTAKTTESTATGWKKFNPFHWGRALLPKIGITNDEETDSLIKVYSRVEDEPDPAFLSSLSNLVNRHPLLSEDASQLLDSAVEGLRQKLQRLTDSVVAKLSLAYERQLKHQCELVARTGKQKEQLEAFSEYRCQVRTSLAGTNAQSSLTISWIKPRKGWSSDIEMKASTRQHLEPNIAVGIWVLDLGEDDTQRIRDDPTFIPVPRIPQRVQFEKQLPLNWVIRRVQMLGPKKCLLVIDGPEKTRIWIFSPHAGFNIDAPTYHLPLVPNRKYVVAVDEQKRVLAFIMMGTNTCVLQQYLIDLESSAIHGRGSPFNLLPWYDGVTPEISHAAFFSGSNDLCLVESSGRIRVLSIAQQNFRSVLTILHRVKNGPRTLRVFHHASFGSNAGGILNTLPESFSGVDAFSITSIAERGNVFILGLDSSRTTIVSARVEISRKEIEYQFRAKQEGPRQHSGKVSASNTLVTCFSEVWERFPVAAAIQRETISREDRQPSSLTFVCDAHKPYFTSYFLKMITAFEESSKKPTGHRLASIQLSSSSFDDLVWETPSSSNFKAGEWVVELLCLIPIHIAVTDENRLIPLKDGVRDPALERELLGADVSSIIDSISLGWYESILSVYMASKEVKVISSMGEQSVGKSYSLNHMVDSSFAGSAVRTTEGVWLSVCPTRDCVVVALDFEGVHSIERTPQEDMLLVLFNTALSNLIIFRNNFALSRDVANMFTSFQASTHLFDPKSNPKLFKGLLAIVIKDVVDADKKDIVKEYYICVETYLSKEQASNFITVLHNSQLTVIPWSVILSSDFYRLFFKLGKTLFNQKTTHDSAGEFLITLKTLMAKMKAQDWGSLDHTVIKHRVATLSKLLPSVLVLGRSGSDTDGEELKNMDNQVPIPSNDTPAKFYLGKIGNERAEALDRLVKEWNIDASRRPTSDLVQHLNDIAGRRIASAEEWIKQNVSRFPQDNGDMRALKRQDTAGVTYAIHPPIYAAALVYSTRDEAVKDIAPNLLAMITPSICALPESISAERHAISTMLVCTTDVNSPAILRAHGLTTKITLAMYVIIVWRVQLNVSCVQGSALPLITSTALRAMRSISADNPIPVIINAEPLEFAKSTQLLTPLKQRSPVDTRHLVTRSIRKLQNDWTVRSLFHPVPASIQDLTFTAPIPNPFTTAKLGV
ncbi:hypothetical protein FRB90_000300 [Tulasnella sp. 427]|nr:hypothetical protein FRB90_000300 [Tulasnella sp. 427]